MLRPAPAPARAGPARSRPPRPPPAPPPREGAPARGGRQRVDRPREQLVRGWGARRRRARSRRDDAGTHGIGRLATCGGELDRTRPRHGDDEVEPVEERPRELVAERRDPLWRAGALGARVSAGATSTQVHRSDDLEAGWKDSGAGRAYDRD